MPLAFGEWELERGSDIDETDGLDEPDATEKASKGAGGSARISVA